MMKRILALFLSLVIAISCVEPVTLHAARKEETEPVVIPEDEFVKVVDDMPAESMSRASTIAGGTCGKNVKWTVDSDYTLTITGSGAMDDYRINTEQPWHKYANDIKSIKIGSGITRVGGHAFQSFNNVEKLEWPSSIQEIGEWAFNMTFVYVESVFPIPSNIINIGHGAFASNKHLQGFNVSTSNKYFSSVNGHLLNKQKTILVQAARLTDTQITLPDTVYGIMPGAMIWGDFTSFVNKNIREVSYNAFQICYNMKTLELESAEWIGETACYSCTSLENVVFSEPLEKICNYAFWNCTALKSVVFKGNAPKFDGDNIFKGVTATVYYDSTKTGWTSAVRQNYGGTLTWKDTAVSKINNTITASNKTKTVLSSDQTFSLGASAKDNASLSYSSDNSSITVNSSGNVTIKKNYIGSATITITSAETSQYKKTTKKITVTVNPQKPVVSALTSSGTSVVLKVYEDIGDVKYDIQYATNSSFDNYKYSYANVYESSGYTFSNLEEGKTYYFRVRGTKKVDGYWYDSAWSEVQYITIPVSQQTQTITAKDITKNASAKERKIAIGATCNGNATFTYKSDNNKIKIENGKVVIPKNFVGKATITITAKATSSYKAATKKITLTVNKNAQTITAKNLTKTVTSSKRKIAIGATCKGSVKLTYKSSNSKVKIENGKVVIPKNFIGKTTITITAKETAIYKKATKKITVKVNPVKATITSVKVEEKGGKYYPVVKNKKDAGVDKYQIEFAANPEFKQAISANNSYAKNGYRLHNCKMKKNTPYYLRVRGFKVVNGTTYYGAWSNVKKITIK